MVLLMFALIAGPVGDYLGFQYDGFITGSGYDSMFTVGGDSGDSTVTDSSIVLDTLTHNGYPAYLNRHVRISDILDVDDITIAWEIGDSMFSYFSQADTTPMKIGVIPFSVGAQWDMGIAGETLCFDIDGDHIIDTLAIQSAEAEVLGYTPLTVPLGTFYAYGVLYDAYMTGWQSILGDSCRIHVDQYHWFVPYLNRIKDSTVVIDSMFQYIWFEGARIVQYTEATDTGYTGITELSENTTVQSAIPIPNGIMLFGDRRCTIEIFDVSGRIRMTYDCNINGTYRLTPSLQSGIYFARIRSNRKDETVKFIFVE
jgi:hypothetical protein